jgi:hypothetical protein
MRHVITVSCAGPTPDVDSISRRDCLVLLFTSHARACGNEARERACRFEQLGLPKTLNLR